MRIPKGYGMVIVAVLSFSSAREKIYAPPTVPATSMPPEQRPALPRTARCAHFSVSYNGPLYQVRRLSDGKTQNISPIAPGDVANTAVQDTFLNGKQGTVSIIYDQSPNGNRLKSHYSGLWTPADTEANPSSPGAKLQINGHTVYGIYTYGGFTPNAGVGYRNNATKGLVTGNAGGGHVLGYRRNAL